MSTKVFISAGTPANEPQRSFRDAVVNAIELAGFTPRLLDAKDWDYRNPLRGLRRAMDECSGAVVVAYARYQFDAGGELRDGGVRLLREFTAGQVLSSLPWYELLGIAMTLVGSLLTAASIGYRLGSGQWPLG